MLILQACKHSNGQVEHFDTDIINVLTKLCIDLPDKWYYQVRKMQVVVN